MTEKTRDVRLGDLAAVDADITRSQPRIGEVPVVDSSTPQPSHDAGPGGLTGTRSAARPASGPPPKGPDTRRAESSVPLIALAVSVVVLAGIVVLLFNELSRLRDAVAAVEARSSASVATLESQVASTSTSMRSADTETQKSLNVLAGDINRLNDGLNRIARALEAESQARGEVGKELAVLAQQARDMAKAGTDHQGRVDARLKSVAESLDQLAARQKTQADALARVERSSDAAQLRADVGVLGASVRQLQEDHEKRLKAAEQASASNDAFRRQVNATIDRLQQQVGELYQRR